MAEEHHGPVDERLWQLTYEAAVEGIKIIAERETQGDYFSDHDDWPELEWDDGFPRLRRAFSGPTDYSSGISGGFLGLLPDERNRPKLEDSVEFKRLAEYIRAQAGLAKHFLSKDHLETDVLRLVGNLLDRYVHVSGSMLLDPEEFRKIYLPVEASLTREKLAVHLLVPLLGITFEEDCVALGDRAAVRMDDPSAVT